MEKSKRMDADEKELLELDVFVIKLGIVFTFCISQRYPNLDNSVHVYVVVCCNLSNLSGWYTVSIVSGPKSTFLLRFSERFLIVDYSYGLLDFSKIEHCGRLQDFGSISSQI